MTIEERVEKVEMELARAKRHNRLLLAGVLLGVVLLALGATTPGAASREDVVKARKFMLVDVNDKTRALLAVDEKGVMLGLLDENGKPRVCLTVDKEGPQLTLRDENNKPRAALLLFDIGSGLTLDDGNGETCVMLHAGKDEALLSLYDKNGKGLLTVDKKDGPKMRLADENGKVVWQAPP
jgi:hypothetical protein